MSALKFFATARYVRQLALPDSDGNGLDAARLVVVVTQVTRIFCLALYPVKADTLTRDLRTVCVVRH
jgi:hypothetical protein